MSSHRRRWLIGLAGVAVLVALVATTYGVAQRLNLRSLREATAHRMDIYSASLQAELNRFAYLPTMVALDKRVLALAQAPQDRSARATVNAYLETINAGAGASAIYVMNHDGLTLAASNWNQPVSFVDMNFAYRPYFQDAAAGRPGRFYGIGTVSREPGYYFAHAIVERGVVVGVVAVKVDLESLDDAWGHEGEKIVVADLNGVIFLSTEPTWKFRTLHKLSDETKGQLAATRQYSEAGTLSLLGLTERHVIDENTSIVQALAEPSERHPQGTPTDYMVHRQRVQGTDWQLIVMSEVQSARAAAHISAALATLTLILVTLLVLHFKQRRRIVMQTLSARIALQKANDELEKKVQLRTEALSDANGLLQGEIVERKRAEETLRATLEDLVQTAKMAVLGQMSAGITQELNQPLAALRTLSANAIVFLNRGESSNVELNLQVIARVTDHMGKITGQLKRFARKSAVDLQPVAISAVLTDALFLMLQSMRAQNVSIEQSIEPPQTMAMCDATRLEQVLLNLLNNAADAVANAAQPRILICSRVEAGWVRLEVHDNGPGIDEAIASRLFEPFFSTKHQGEGLGLGLAISADIARQLGGTLRAGASDVLGGAMFTVQLKAVEMEAVHG